VKEGIRYFVPLLDKEGYIISDWRGVPRAVYDELGKEIWRGEFGPFGEPLYERGMSNYIPFRLYGMYKDIETGLYYNVRRYYDWRVGRYLQPDPVSDLNLYAYVNNSPYDAVDPVGMFQTTMRVTKTVWSPPTDSWHEGHAIHERITENAINEAFWCFTTDGAKRSICRHKDRVENWDMGPEVCFAYDQFCLRCRTYANTVAQGTNRADCLYATKSYFHCDNSDFAGCYDIAWEISRPAIYDLINCSCADISPIILPIIGTKRETETGGGGRGCSVIPRLQKRSFDLCSCSFGTFSVWFRVTMRGFPPGARIPSSDIPREQMDYEKLGRLLHPIQDFWAHSTAIYVSGCRRYVSGGCTEYYREVRWDETTLPNENDAKSRGIISGVFMFDGWTDIEDFLCRKGPFSTANPKGFPPRCDAHCVLNKDSWGGLDRTTTDPCAKGVQRDAYFEVESRAKDSTKHYLDIFCRSGGDLCLRLND